MSGTVLSTCYLYSNIRLIMSLHLWILDSNKTNDNNGISYTGDWVGWDVNSRHPPTHKSLDVIL